VTGQEPAETNPEKQGAPCVQCKRVHPGIGCGGYAPPVETRFKPGVSGNPGGKPKGSFSIRAAIKRELAANYDPETMIGAKTREAALKYLEAAFTGDDKLVSTLGSLIHEVEGRPLEHIERVDNQTRTIVVRPGATEPPEMP